MVYKFSFFLRAGLNRSVISCMMWTDIIYSCKCHWYYFRQTWLSPSDFWEYGNIMHVEFANWKMQQNDMAGRKSNGKKNLVFCNTINSPWLIRMQHFINLKPLWAPGFEVTSIKRKGKKSAVPLKVFHCYIEIIFLWL